MSRFDPHATQFITFSQMSDFIGSLDPPLGIPKPNSLAIVSFDLPIAKVVDVDDIDDILVLGGREKLRYFLLAGR